MKTVFLPRTRGYVGAEWQLIGLAECLRFRWARTGPFFYLYAQRWPASS